MYIFKNLHPLLCLGLSLLIGASGVLRVIGISSEGWQGPAAGARDGAGGGEDAYAGMRVLKRWVEILPERVKPDTLEQERVGQELDVLGLICLLMFCNVLMQVLALSLSLSFSLPPTLPPSLPPPSLLLLSSI